MKNSIRSIIALTLFTAGSTTAFADNTWEDKSKDAWLDGKAETTLLFNSHLNSFDINTDVQDRVVILTGKVDSAVDKSLAEELVASLEGVESVDNKLSVINKKQESELVASLTDSKVEAVVKSKLLMSSDVSGTSIEVEVLNGVVILTGEVDSDSEEELAVMIAKNSEDVKSVINKLEVADS
ncbi:BON domain-containing protein [Psychromonas sp. SR45-3]|uniref:BON domain-containing protein n=1 Tax=Psychromonas sp. SR45-3 TaxID=2760930 RepID=UPI0015FDEB63|nr:BON domain-containing protein [Psychromonas sp. SR45-3]MBB1274878.1 BON domain-containing protein [Psychromonas sp. SR45-3]